MTFWMRLSIPYMRRGEPHYNCIRIGDELVFPTCVGVDQHLYDDFGE